MRLGSLIVLGAVFFSAFAGRAAVLAARTGDAELDPATRVAAQCINGAFAEELKEQAERLETAAAEQTSKDQIRAVALAHVNERIDELEKANEALLSSASAAAKQEEGAAVRVASLYEKMKPDLAGGIISGMDPAFAAGILLSMNGDAASAILSALAPERAYAITVLMADAS
jgi:flagellar motility protein MotE (MotC chaperone)